MTPAPLQDSPGRRAEHSGNVTDFLAEAEQNAKLARAILDFIVSRTGAEKAAA